LTPSDRDLFLRDVAATLAANSATAQSRGPFASASGNISARRLDTSHAPMPMKKIGRQATAG
jgi:hypothetical protein